MKIPAASIFKVYFFLTLIVLFPAKLFAQKGEWQLSGSLHFGHAERIVHLSNDFIYAFNLTGIRRSTDSGTTWTNNNNGLTELNVKSILNPRADILLAGTESGKIFRSNDNGENWEIYGVGLTGNQLLTLYIKDNSIFAGTANAGIFRSDDFGFSWTNVNEGLTCTSVNSFAIDSAGKIYAATSCGIFTSPDNGNSWNQSPAFKDTLVREIKINSAGILFLIRYSELHRSTDMGSSWENVSMQLIWHPEFPFPFMQYLPSNAYAFSKNDIIISGTDNQGIFISTNNGSNWSTLKTIPVRRTESNSVASLTAVDINSTGKVFVATKRGMYCSADTGNNWSEINIHLADWAVRSLEYSNEGNLFAGTDLGAFRLLNNETNWQAINNGIENYPLVGKILVNSKGFLFAGCAAINSPYSAPVFRSTNNGEAWIKTGVIDGNTPSASNDLMISKKDYIFSSSNLSPIGLSTNDGTDWNYLSTGGSFSLASNSHDEIYYGNLTVYHSTDDGINWTEYPLFNSYSTKITKLVVNPEDDLFAATDSGLYRLKYNETIWEKIGEDLPKDYMIPMDVDTFFYGPMINTLTINRLGHIFVSYFRGTFYSTDKGDNWTKINDENFSSFEIDSSGYIYAGTYSGSVYKSKWSTNITSLEDKNHNLISEFSLSQNYPNPFNPATFIMYTLPVSGLVTIKVFDILGNEIGILVNEFKIAGNYQVEFNGNGLTSGIYLYNMKSGIFSDTKKLVLIK